MQQDEIAGTPRPKPMLVEQNNERQNEVLDLVIEDVIHPEADVIIPQIVFFIILILCTYYISDFLKKEFDYYYSKLTCTMIK
jgi:hypothetical protein